uniref:Lipid-A-disaccharide synthase n=1 Tax=Gongylonema pulchrum TaxID=637853 RepID=A0A183DMW8_9BILA
LDVLIQPSVLTAYVVHHLAAHPELLRCAFVYPVQNAVLDSSVPMVDVAHFHFVPITKSDRKGDNFFCFVKLC